MNAYFTELGRTVLERWRGENFALGKFPGIARGVLEERPPNREVDLAAFMRDFLLSDDQAFQTDSAFGEPEVVVYSHPRFYIQVLFWLDGTTAIHQHEFSGAFHVMHGSSIHAEYAFEKARTVTPWMRVGDLRMKKMELLETGRTVEIVSGAQAIHSLFHLDSPSVTVVVRTQHDPGTGPQLNYLPPGMAIDPMHSDLLTTRRRQLLDVLEQTEDSGYADIVTTMIADLDFERGFYVLQNCMGYLEPLGEWAAVLKAFEKRHGALAKGVAATLREEVRRGVIKGLRGAIAEPDHRFFLAVLMNAPTRGELMKLVGERFPGQEPGAVTMRWVEELMEVSEDGVSVLDAWWPEAVEVNDVPAAFLAAIEFFVKGGKKPPAELRGLSTGEVRELREVFEGSALGVLCKERVVKIGK